MTVMRQSLPLFLFLLLLLGCGKTPRGVLNEDDMAAVLVDLGKGDAYIDTHNDLFPDDSTKLVLKQSILSQHGVTQAEFDSSLVWYAHNMDVLVTVYDRAIGMLKDEQAELSPYVTRSAEELAAVRPHRRIDFGDDEVETQDMWMGPRRLIVPHGMDQGYYRFEFRPTTDGKQGLTYALSLKALPFHSRLHSLLAIDYDNGLSDLISQPVTSAGWVDLLLPADSSRRVTRVYGYIAYRMSFDPIAVIDSISLKAGHHIETGSTTVRLKHIVRDGQSATSTSESQDSTLRDSVKLVRPVKPFAKGLHR